jgi:hypothetical protein
MFFNVAQSGSSRARRKVRFRNAEADYNWDWRRREYKLGDSSQSLS